MKRKRTQEQDPRKSEKKSTPPARGAPPARRALADGELEEVSGGVLRGGGGNDRKGGRYLGQ